VATGAKDLYDVVRCLRGYPGADASLGIYVAALQEHLEMAEIRRWVWVDTGSMIADATTKWMKDILITWWFKTGHWEPDDYELFEPEMMRSLKVQFLLCCPTSLRCSFCGPDANVSAIQDDKPTTLEALLLAMD
jgi:hypothetical protein